MDIISRIDCNGNGDIVSPCPTKEAQTAVAFVSTKFEELTSARTCTVAEEIKCRSSKRRRIEKVDPKLVKSDRKRARYTAKSVRFVKGSDLLREVTFKITDEEVQNAWYSASDYREFHKDIQSTVLAFELGVLDRIPEDEVCLRGLEAHLSNTMLEARISGKQTMINFILQTQEVQRCHQLYDNEFVRGLSAMLSKNTCEDALKLAAYDAEEARQIFAALLES